MGVKGKIAVNEDVAIERVGGVPYQLVKIITGDDGEAQTISFANPMLVKVEGFEEALSLLRKIEYHLSIATDTDFLNDL